MTNQETIITKPERVGILGKCLTLGVLLIFTLILALSVYSFAIWHLAVVDIITFLFFLPAILSNFSEKYSVDSRFLQFTSGVFTTRIIKIPVRDIQGISSSQNLAQKHFNIGTVFIVLKTTHESVLGDENSPKVAQDRVSLDNIKEFKEVMELVSKNMDQQKISYNREDS